MTSPTGEPTPTAPKTPEQVKIRILQTRILYSEMTDDHISQGQKGSLIGTFNKACGSDGRRHLLFSWLFNKESSKDLTAAEWTGLIQWADMFEMGGVWTCQKFFNTEVEACMNYALGIDYVPQLELPVIEPAKVPAPAPVSTPAPKPVQNEKVYSFD